MSKELKTVKGNIELESLEAKLIVLKQKPIIEFSKLEARGLEVADRIGLMNLDGIDATEDNRSIMKKMRAELNKELDVFESQRKMIHAAITKPYKDFTSCYDDNIKTRYTSAVASLKDKILSVEEVMLADKKIALNAYFDMAVGEIDFLSIDMLNLNIILSATDKKLKCEIDVFIGNVSSELATIKAMPDSIRIMSLYRKSLDMNGSISTVLADIKCEKELEEERVIAKEAEDKRLIEQAKLDEIKKERDAIELVERTKQKAEAAERNRVQAEKNAKANASKEVDDELKRVEAEKKRAADDLVIAEQNAERIKQEKALKDKEEFEASVVHTMVFKVSGTIEHLKEIKLFMDNIGVDYE